MKRISICLGLIATLLLLGVEYSHAACTVCNGKTGKCYTFKTLNCKNFHLNSGDSCIQGQYKIARATVFRLEPGVVTSATRVLAQGKIDFLRTQASDQERALIIMDESKSEAASRILRKASIAFKVENIPQNPVENFTVTQAGLHYPQIQNCDAAIADYMSKFQSDVRLQNLCKARNPLAKPVAILKIDCMPGTSANGFNTGSVVSITAQCQQ